jgi:lysozyme family protein
MYAEMLKQTTQRVTIFHNGAICVETTKTVKHTPRVVADLVCRIVRQRSERVTQLSRFTPYVRSYLIPETFIIRRLVDNGISRVTNNKKTVTNCTLKYKLV